MKIRAALGEKSVRNISVAVLAGLGLTSLTGCWGDPKLARGSAIRPYLNEHYRKGDIKKCVGTAILRSDGHIRLEPVISGREADANVPTSNTPPQEVILHDPHQMQLGDTEGASSTWYIERTAENWVVFINQDALAQRQLACNTPAAPADQPGQLEVR